MVVVIGSGSKAEKDLPKGNREHQRCYGHAQREEGLSEIDPLFRLLDRSIFGICSHCLDLNVIFCCMVFLLYLKRS